jgi:Ca2+-binding RTX toxin-like protein
LLLGGSGEDWLIGEDGDDLLMGDQGRDTLEGGSGDDRLYVDDGDALANGGSGSFDVLVIGANGAGLTRVDLSHAANQNASNGGPELQGFEAVDATHATAAVTLTGALFGTQGSLLIGSVFDDRLTGASGNDTLVAQAGDDTLTGGDGADLFVYAGQGTDLVTIVDFVPGSDVLQLPAALGLSPAAALAALVAAGSDAVLALPGGGSVTFVGLGPTIAGFAADDFTLG